jgi:hypothetical protein
MSDGRKHVHGRHAEAIIIDSALVEERSRSPNKLRIGRYHPSFLQHTEDPDDHSPCGSI